jgi:hypothetical protein
MTKVKIILVQSRNTQNALQFRIAKLVGGVFVETVRPTSRTVHVGDLLNEREAEDLASAKEYEVIVTEKGGAT